MKTAMSIQQRDKIAIYRRKMGEQVAHQYCESNAKPKILYGTDIINIKSAHIQEWQTTCCSGVLGIERGEKEGGYNGLSPMRLCIINDYKGRFWDHEVGMSAWRMHETHACTNV